MEPEARSPKPEARSPKPEARSPKPGYGVGLKFVLINGFHLSSSYSRFLQRKKYSIERKKAQAVFDKKVKRLKIFTIFCPLITVKQRADRIRTGRGTVYEKAARVTTGRAVRGARPRQQPRAVVPAVEGPPAANETIVKILRREEVKTSLNKYAVIPGVYPATAPRVSLREHALERVSSERKPFFSFPQWLSLARAKLRPLTGMIHFVVCGLCPAADWTSTQTAAQAPPRS
jgi:hypothetical protein